MLNYERIRPKAKRKKRERISALVGSARPSGSLMLHFAIYNTISSDITGRIKFSASLFHSKMLLAVDAQSMKWHPNVALQWSLHWHEIWTISDKLHRAPWIWREEIDAPVNRLDLATQIEQAGRHSPIEKSGVCILPDL